MMKKEIERYLKMLVDDINEVDPKFPLNEVRALSNFLALPTSLPSLWTRFPLFLLVRSLLTVITSLLLLGHRVILHPSLEQLSVVWLLGDLMLIPRSCIYVLAYKVILR